MDDVAVVEGVVNNAADGARGDPDGVLDLGMVIPSRTKSSDPDDDTGGAATGEDVRAGALGASIDA